MKLAISTRWASAREGVDPRRILPELLDLGFGGVLLDRRLPARFLEKMRPELGRGEPRVVALEGFVPVPEGMKPGVDPYDVLTFASEDAEARAWAVRAAVDTLRRAADLECGVVVLPLGRVAFDDKEETFLQFAREDRIKEEEGIELKEAVYAARARKAERAMNRVRGSLEKALAEADRLRVALAVPTPEGAGDLPSHAELAALRAEFAGAPLGYWHRPARAARRERFGWEPESRWLEAFGAALAGATLDDLDEDLAFRDLPAPGGLEKRLGATSRAAEGRPQVLDPDPERAREEIRDAAAWLREIAAR